MPSAHKPFSATIIGSLLGKALGGISLNRIAGAAAIIAAPALLSACAPARPLYVDQAWIRLSPNKDMPSAGYFIVHGGKEPVKLLSVTTPMALRVELHESMNEGGLATMKPISSIDIPAKTDVKFAPGGKHMMIWGINPAALQAGKITLTFTFSNGDRILFDAVIQKTGAGTPSADAGQHDHMAMGNMAGMNMADMNMAGMDMGNQQTR